MNKCSPPCSGGDRNTYDVKNLVSDIVGIARFTDPLLVNPWGLARSEDGPWWVADNETRVLTVYAGNGRPFPDRRPQVVAIPNNGSPTGLVYNSVLKSHPTAFRFSATIGGPISPAVFIAVTEQGSIVAWSPCVDPNNAVAVVTIPGAVYTGAAIAVVPFDCNQPNATHGPVLFVANFASGQVEAYDRDFLLRGFFTDPELATLCAGNPGQCFSPFNIAAIGDKHLIVTYALRGPNGEPVFGPGLGFVDLFSTDGILLKRLVSRGELNAPWGIALAPESKEAGFFGGSLWIGNHGDGRILAFDPSNGKYIGTVRQIDGLWGLGFAAGEGTDSGPRDRAFFTAGIADEEHGLFGSLKARDGPVNCCV